MTFRCLVPVDFGLVRASNREAEVAGLVAGEGGELGTNEAEVLTGNILVQLLREHRNAELVVLNLGPELDLGEHLVGERAAHDERRVPGGAPKVDKPALGKEDDVAAVLHRVPVDLRLDVDNLLGVGLDPRRVDLAVKVPDVADNGVLLHLEHVLGGDDARAAGGRHKDVTLLAGLVHRRHLVPLHRGLERVDRVNLGDKHPGAKGPERLGASLAHIAVAGNHRDLARNHDVRSPLDAVKERLAAAVQVVKLGLGDRVVDIDGRDLELALLEHLVEVVHSRGGLLRHAVDAGEELGELGVDQVCQVTAVVENHVEWLAIREDDGLLDAPVVLLLGLALPGVHRDAGSGDGCSSLVLGRENVARRPSHLGTESGKGLDEHGGLRGHVEAAGNSGTLERLGLAELRAEVHEARHLVLGEHDVLATEISEGNVGDFVGGLCGGHGD
mmetsp:Transcript_6152/g.15753  ORF Transcript_6152/g.15753 Transcript_6152/m.15753 type:complete len:443 (+) Transcript_6152:36-1364(+)